MGLGTLPSGTILLKRAIVIGLLAFGMAACTKLQIPAHMKPLPKDTIMLLGKKKMEAKDPIFIRIFKEESELEVWKLKSDGFYHHFKTYPICNWSGGLGPKKRQGDKQAPEGFYQVTKKRMNPNSSFHLSFNLGYPNAFDRAHLRTGNYLMVHGKCRSAGCYAMTDGLMEEIYALARESFAGGQDVIHVHAFPFRMTDANMRRYKHSRHYRFWRILKQGYDHFQVSRSIPEVAVCERRYVVNVAWPGGKPRRLNSRGRCPNFKRPLLKVYVPQVPGATAVSQSAANGLKIRTLTTAKKLGGPGDPMRLGGKESVDNR